MEFVNVGERLPAASAAFAIPRRNGLHRAAQSFIRLGRFIQTRQKLRIGFPADGKDRLVQQGFLCGLPRGLEHEIRARLAGKRRRPIDEPAFLGPDPKVERISACRRAFGIMLSFFGHDSACNAIVITKNSEIHRLPRFIRDEAVS
jgi:hypothetical protein